MKKCNTGSGFAVIAVSVWMLCSCAVLSGERKPDYFAGSVEELITANVVRTADTEYEKDGVLAEDKKGRLQEAFYGTTVCGPDIRRMLVYLPRDYDKTDRNYPVVYLLHGARGYESSWIKKGDILNIADSLTSRGLAEEAIIVMPNVNQYDSDDDMGSSRRKNALESLFEVDGAVESGFINDVVEFTDRHFRTIPDKRHRAIAGLSIGGLQTMYITANSPDTFGYIGMFSALTRIMRKGSPHSTFYNDAKDKLDAQFANAPELYLIMIGRKDIFLGDNRRFSRYLTQKGYPHSFIVTPGGHDWPYWKSDCIHFLQQVFK